MTAATTAVLFSGQGSQHVGMMSWLFGASPAARSVLDEAESVLSLSLGRLMQRGPETRLRDTRIAQPAILTASIALHRALGAPRDVVAFAGHSVGEYAAWVASGALDFSQAVRLVAERGRLLHDAVTRPGGMLAALGVSIQEAEPLRVDAARDGALDVAALNAPGEVVFSGERAPLRRLQRALERRGARCVRLRVALPFHSRLLAAAQPPFREVISRIDFRPPAAPVVCNLDGCVHADVSELGGLLVRHLCEPVLWETSLRTLERLGARTVVELGPGRALLGHARRVLPAVVRLAVEDLEDLERARDALASEAEGRPGERGPERAA